MEGRKGSGQRRRTRGERMMGRRVATIMNEWNSINNNPADVKELIPEFYSNDPSFLVNAM